jgi:DNA mismatch repair protein MutS
MMKQYRALKAKHPGDILFFRLGDFYEMFEEDAKEASRLLGLTLTSRAKGDGAVPMAGVPAHAAEGYLRRLLAAGRRVALCEQTDDGAGGMMRREVVRVVTPGTVTEEGMLQAKLNTWLAAAHPGPGDTMGLAWADCSTGEFRLAELPSAEAGDFLARLGPAELLVSDAGKDVATLLPVPATRWGDWAFAGATARRALLEHFKVATLSSFGCEGLSAGLQAAGALLAYVKETHPSALSTLRALVPERPGEAMPLDRATLAGLEILRSARSGDARGSLLSVMDRTVTAAGGRLLRRWVSAPLVSRPAILERQEAVASLASDAGLRRACGVLREVYDLERLAGRVAASRANARDALAIAQSLKGLPTLRAALVGAAGRLAVLREALDPLEDLSALLERAIHLEPPLGLMEGGIIREGYDAGLDRMRTLVRDADAWISSFEAAESARTGISSLKVSRHRVFGFLIEVTNVHRVKVPAEYVRRQTLKNAERYTTEALQTHEAATLKAERESSAREYALFGELRETLLSTLPRLMSTAGALAELDALAGLAEAARGRGMVRPEIVEEPVLEIQEGRHPVLESLVHPFVPNDAALSGDTRALIVTGPNMAGKSTFIRQVALIQLMAQVGAFVPAKRARLGVADRIFARAGAVDDLAHAQSTFMVEMSETALILRQATRRSLAVLDEIGRGTSTFDGVSIAWAVAEALATRIGARTLFATHYHELAALAQEHPGVVENASVAVREDRGGVVFLHRIEKGSADRSYGLHVAALAGVPEGVVARAKGILEVLEGRGSDLAQRLAEGVSSLQKPAPTLFPEAPDPLREKLKGIEVERLTPLEALNLLAELKRELECTP